MKKTCYILRFLGSEKNLKSEILTFAQDDYGKSWTVPSDFLGHVEGSAPLHSALPGSIRCSSVYISLGNVYLSVKSRPSWVGIPKIPTEIRA